MHPTLPLVHPAISVAVDKSVVPYRQCSADRVVLKTGQWRRSIDDTAIWTKPLPGTEALWVLNEFDVVGRTKKRMAGDVSGGL